MRRAALLLLAGCAALPGGCGHAPGYPANPVPRPSEVRDFASLYEENCAACHGANGQNGPAMDLANAEYQALVDDATLRKWIAGGMPGTEMPAFAQSDGGMLTDAQVNLLIRGMRNAWLKPNAFGGATPPAYAQTQRGDAHRGQLAYEARCIRCHEPANQQITNPNYLALVGNQALRTVIIAGRPDIGQPDWSHLGQGGKTATPLSGEDVDNIVAYLASLRNPTQDMSGAAMPAGAATSTGR